MQERFGTRRVLLTSCTAALEMAALLYGLGPGDEVILPSYTFVSTANAVALRGATPVFVDIRRDTLNIDERLIEAAVTSRTRAIFPVHYAGVACEMDEIMAIAKRHSLLVVEDAWQGVFAQYKRQWLGTIGHMGCYSFHETKNFSCGEGRALVVNDPAFEARAEILREKGTNRSQFLRGQVDKYTWVDIGSSYVPSDMLAAFLLGQLENMEKITTRRGEIFHRYATRLAPLAAKGLIRAARGHVIRSGGRHDLQRQPIELALRASDKLVRDLRVARRARQIGMPQQDLNDADVGAALEQMRGEAVPQGTDRDLLGQAGRGTSGAAGRV
jgi:dTDP-4-amino-4,6-dideoxygalactose transaminase